MNRNDKLLQIAIEEKALCKFYCRRIHNIIGTPVDLDNEIHRLHIEISNGETSILLGDISAFEYPSIVIDRFKKENNSTKSLGETTTKIKKVKIDKNEPEKEKVSLTIEYQQYVNNLKEGEKKLSYNEWYIKYDNDNFNYKK